MRRHLEELIRSGKTEFTHPAQLSERVTAAIRSAARRPSTRGLRWKIVLAAGTVALVLLAVASLLWPQNARAELQKARSALLKVKRVHGITRTFDVDASGNWVSTGEQERWQIGKRQWEILKLPVKGAIRYSYSEGPGQAQMIYSPHTGKLREFGQWPVWFFWDWGQLEEGIPGWLKVGEGAKVERLKNRRWRGRDVKVIRMTLSDRGGKVVSIFFIDRKSGLPVRHDATAQFVGPDEDTTRVVEEWDYARFDASRLFNPVEMAKRYKSSRSDKPKPAAGSQAPLELGKEP